MTQFWSGMRANQQHRARLPELLAVITYRLMCAGETVPLTITCRHSLRLPKKQQKSRTIVLLLASLAA